MRKFEGSRSLEKQMSDLYGVVQGPKESVRDYYNRCNKEMISFKDLDIKTAIKCFRKGLILRSKLYNRLTKYPCQTFQEVKSGALVLWLNFIQVDIDATTRRLDDMTPCGIVTKKFRPEDAAKDVRLELRH